MIAMPNMTDAELIAKLDEPVMFTILGQEFDIDELRDIVNHGMSAGVSGFIYTRECVDAFDANDDVIQDFLSDWYYDCIGGDEGSFAYFARDIEDINQLKNKLVWAYVELKADSILQQIDDQDEN